MQEVNNSPLLQRAYLCLKVDVYQYLGYNSNHQLTLLSCLQFYLLTAAHLRTRVANVSKYDVPKKTANFKPGKVKHSRT